MSRLVLLLSLSSCLPTFTPAGLYACNNGQCPPGFDCDEGVCCVRGARDLSCPTLPGLDGFCPRGGAEASLFYRDEDGDGAGTATVSRFACVKPDGPWVRDSQDCDDNRNTVGPGIPDGRLNTAGACDGFDNNCNGDFDEEAPNRRLFYQDLDGDEFGATGAQGILSCGAPPGTANSAGDCDDTTVTRSPSARERCNGIDDDCNGLVDDGPLIDAEQPDGGFAFLCQVPNARGVCSLGRSVCRAGQIVCSPRFGPSREVCNGGVDDDCDGSGDEAPECGGPTDLFGPGVRVTARAFASDTGQSFFQLCPEGLNGTLPVPLSGRVANAMLPEDHPFLVLSFQPSDGGLWDLSAPRNQLNLRIDTQFMPAGSSSWGVGSHFRNPALSFCGVTSRQLYRLPTEVSAGLREPSLIYDGYAPLTAGNGWLAGSSAGYDLAATSSVHVIVRPTVAGAVRFGLDAGFSR